MIRILIVEDSPVQRELLSFLIEEDGQFKIVGCAVDGEEGVAMAASLRPDVVLMDYHLPKLNGSEATRRIMESTPVPVVITSSSLMAEDVAVAFDAVRAGALAVCLKPTAITSPDHARMVAELLRTLKLMAEVKVVRRWPRAVTPAAVPVKKLDSRRQFDLIAIGGSTGAPAVIGEFLAAMPADLRAPVLVVQHMARGFSAGFVQWLNAKTSLNVKLAVNHERLSPASVYIAPDDRHLGIDTQRRIVLGVSEPENGFRPSISYLFHSVAAVAGSKAIAIILTGMGRDGVSGLKAIRDAGGMTFAQDESSCVVFGMPQEAIRQGAAEHVLNPRDIAQTVITSLEPRFHARHG